VQAAAESNDSYQGKLTEALVQLQSAIQLLDEAEAPGHIAAHVDLAVNELMRVLSIAHAPSLSRVELNLHGNG
jgi:hypothetical protein